MVVDVQCIMQALGRSPSASTPSSSPPRRRPRSRARRTSSSTSTAPSRRPARSCAWRSTTTPNRGAIHIPDYHEPLVAGFSHEYINYMQGGLYRGSFRPLNDAIIAGRIRGLAAVVGCNNARVTQDEPIVEIDQALIADDVLVVVTGCAATGAAKAGYLQPGVPRPGRSRPARGLRGHRHPAGAARGLLRGQLAHPHHAHRVATEGGLGEDISDLPAVGICPEWMCEKARHRLLLRGLRRLRALRHALPGRGRERGHQLMTEGWEEIRRRHRVRARTGRDVRALARAHRHEARGAQAGRVRPVAVRRERRRPADQGLLPEKAARTSGRRDRRSNVYPLAEGHSHEHGDGHAQSEDEGEA